MRRPQLPSANMSCRPNWPPHSPDAPSPADMGSCHREHLLLSYQFSDILQESKQDGVDLETPPNAKMFDPTFVDNSDIASLAKRQLAQSNRMNALPQVNVSFSGLAEILQLQKPTVPSAVDGPRSSTNL